MCDPNMILESIIELLTTVDRQFVGVMIAIGACAILTGLFIDARIKGK